MPLLVEGPCDDGEPVSEEGCPLRMLSRSMVGVLAFALLWLLGLAGCGGGEGGAAPVAPVSPPQVFPVDRPGERPTRVEILLRSGDVLANGLGISNIEDAARARSGTVAAIVSVSNRGGARALLRRSPGGEFETVFDENTAPPEVDVRSLLRLRMAPTGEMIFQAGNGLDSDRLFFVADRAVQTLAGAAPGAVAPEFRVLGNVRVGRGGVVAFVGGGDDCDVSRTPGGSLRHVCTISLFVAREGRVERVASSELSLVDVATSNVRVEIDPDGRPYFSTPGQRGAPAVLRIVDGAVEVLLRAEEEFPGLGTLRDIQAVDITTDGRVLLSATQLPRGEGRQPIGILAVLHGGTLTRMVGQGDSLDGGVVQSLRPIAVDASGRVLYEARLLAESGAQPLRSLRIAGLTPGEDVELARESLPPPHGGRSVVVSLGGSRMNDAGDVIFLLSAGRITAGTVFVDEIRATLRRADGALEGILSAVDRSWLGPISRITIADFDDQANALLIAERGRSGDRALLLAHGSPSERVESD